MAKDLCTWTEDDLFQLGDRLVAETLACDLDAREWVRLADKWREAVNEEGFIGIEVESGSAIDDLQAAMVASGYDLAIGMVANRLGAMPSDVIRWLEVGGTTPGK
jgi:hypothetical protein